MLEAEFLRLVESVQRPDAEAARTFEAWLAGVPLAAVTSSIRDQIKSLGSWSVARRLTSNPPSVLDLCDRDGYVLQLLYWYPLVDQSVYGNYDTDDIHSHFGFIATRALTGTAYIMDVYALAEAKRAFKTGELIFEAGMHRIVSPDDIHSVRATGRRPALSLRVVLPPVVGRMQIYDKQSGFLKEEIVCSTERRTVELAGLIATLDREQFEMEIEDLSKHCLLSESVTELRRLSLMAESQSEVRDSSQRSS